MRKHLAICLAIMCVAVIAILLSFPSHQDSWTTEGTNDQSRLEHWLKALVDRTTCDDEDREHRALGELSKALERSSDDGKRSLLLKAMKSDYPLVRMKAVDHLEKFGKSGVPLLAEMLNDKDSAVRATAFLAFKRMGPDAVAALPTLIEALQNKETRTYALDVLMMMGPAAKDAVPALRQLVDEMEDGNERQEATQILRWIDRDAAAKAIAK